MRSLTALLTALTLCFTSLPALAAEPAPTAALPPGCVIRAGTATVVCPATGTFNFHVYHPVIVPAPPAAAPAPAVIPTTKVEITGQVETSWPGWVLPTAIVGTLAVVGGLVFVGYELSRPHNSTPVDQVPAHGGRW